MLPCVSRISKFILAAVCVSTLALACTAQAVRTSTEIPDSHIDWYAGYGYFHPVSSGINGFAYQDIYNFNVTSSVTGYFNRYIGVQVEGAYFSGNSPRGSFGQCRSGACNDRDPIVYTAEAGPVFRLPLHRWVPFAHVLGGGTRINGPILQPLTWGWGITGGVGVDYILPFWNNRFAVRPIQADYQYSHVDYGPLNPDGYEGGLGKINAIKLSGGIVARFGAPSETRPVELGCSAQPSSVFPGEPVVVNGSTVNDNPKHRPVYTWTTSGGRLTPNDSAATIDTTGLAPGSYTVGGHVSYGKKASSQFACATSFTVKAFQPPTISCSATPSTVTSGATVGINTSGVSPQNRPLTYSYSTTAGQVVSAGPTATLSTAGLATSTVTVTCNVVDDLGQTASSTTMVNVQAQPLVAAVLAEPLCGLSFTRDHARPARVDNEAKGCLDDIALTMNQRSDAQLVIIGNFAPEERPEIAADRAVNIRKYLTAEKGIDPTRIHVRTGHTPGRTARTVLLSPGGIFNEEDTTSFDAGTIHYRGQAYGKGRGHGRWSPMHRHHHHHRRAEGGS